jgi:Bacterial PH domain
MISLQEVESRLAKAGLQNRYWGRAEVRELTNIILPDEAVFHAVNGRYEGGTALLVATDRRLLLIDKKPMMLNLQDVRYDSVAEVDYFARLLDATVAIRTMNKMLKFTSMRQNALRRLTSAVQEAVMELRQFASQQQQSQVMYSEDPTSGQLTPVSIQQFGVPQHSAVSPINYPRQQITFRRRASKYYPTA